MNENLRPDGKVRYNPPTVRIGSFEEITRQTGSGPRLDANFRGAGGPALDVFS